MEQNNGVRYRARGVLPTIRDQGRSVAWLARKIKVSRQYTSDMAHGHIVVTESLANRVSDALDVPLFLLFDVSDGSEFMTSSRARELATA